MPLIPRIRRGHRGQRLPSAVPSREPRLEEVTHNGLTWINIDQPTAVDLEALSSRFDFHELDYEDVLSRRQRPKVDEYTDYIFVVLHFPRYDKSVGRLNTAELDIFLGENFIITCPNSPLRPLSRVFHRCQADEAYRAELFEKGPGYALYRVLSELFDYCFPILDKIGHKLDEIEDGIFEGRAREMVRLISNVKQEIIAFRKIIKPEIATLRFLEAKTATRFIPDSLEIYFDDVIDAGERIRDILENNKEVIEALEDTNENVVQHRLNDILLALTIISATVLPVTLLTSIYGMNIALPLQDSDHAFLAVTALMLAIFASFLGYFKYRKWF